MIRDFEFYHGIVLAKILHGTDIAITLRQFSKMSNASYVLNDGIGLYVKYSTKRLSPWRFTFLTDHQDEIHSLRQRHPSTFVALVCGEDGVVCISHGELKMILDEKHDNTEWISVARRKHEMYLVKGSDGELDFKVGQKEFPEKLFRVER